MRVVESLGGAILVGAHQDLFDSCTLVARELVDEILRRREADDLDQPPIVRPDRRDREVGKHEIGSGQQWLGLALDQMTGSEQVLGEEVRDTRRATRKQWWSSAV